MYQRTFCLLFLIGTACASEGLPDQTDCTGDKCDEQQVDLCVAIQERPLHESEENNGSVETATEIEGSIEAAIDFPSDTDWYRYRVSGTAVLPLSISTMADYAGFESLVCAYYINSNGDNEEQSDCGEGFVAGDRDSDMKGCCTRSGNGGTLTLDPAAANGEFLIKVRAQPGLGAGAECGALHLDINI